MSHVLSQLNELNFFISTKNYELKGSKKVYDFYSRTEIIDEKKINKKK